MHVTFDIRKESAAMAEPFLAEIRIMSFNFPPKGWALCNGQLLPINQNQALFSLLGTTYGGNGQTNFALPNLRGRVPIHVGTGHTLGEAGGEAAHTLTIQRDAARTRTPERPQQRVGVNRLAERHVSRRASTGASTTGPANLTALHPATVTNVGGSQPHTNMQPFLALNFCIALQGIFPSQN